MKKFFWSWFVPFLFLGMALIVWLVPMPALFPTHLDVMEQVVNFFLLGVGVFIFMRLSDERPCLLLVIYLAYIIAVSLISGPIAALLI